jgi:hypothetical protein
MMTPGLDPDEENYKNHFLVKEGLAFQPFNVIFVMVPF